MLISPAFAQAGGAPGGDMFTMLVPFFLVFLIMYFLMIRPQQRRAKQHQEMIKNVRRGDTVITSGGLIAKVTKVTDPTNDAGRFDRALTSSLSRRTTSVVLRTSGSLKASPMVEAIARSRALSSR